MELNSGQPKVIVFLRLRGGANHQSRLIGIHSVPKQNIMSFNNYWTSVESPSYSKKSHGRCVFVQDITLRKRIGSGPNLVWAHLRTWWCAISKNFVGTGHRTRTRRSLRFSLLNPYKIFPFDCVWNSPIWTRINCSNRYPSQQRAMLGQK